MTVVSMKNMKSLFGGHAIIVFYNDTCFLMASASEIARENIVDIFLERKQVTRALCKCISTTTLKCGPL